MGNDASSIPASEMREGESGLTSLKAIMDRIKSHQDIDGSDKFSSDDNNAGMRDDESSGGKSFSGDELSEHEMRAVQGDILGAIKRFDELYNKKDSKDKYSKERTDQRKVKKLQKRDSTQNRDYAKESQDLKNRKKSKRDDLMMAAKHASPAITMPF